ncbi:hypothetical protein BC938DRAFT_482625, partial [Jimgerdemannia flammicorona]
VRNTDFSWWGLVKNVELKDAKSASEVGGECRITFKDGTIQVAHIIELSDLEHFVTYEFIESDPPVGYLSAIHTLRLHHVTLDNTTFVEWSTEFSSDAGQAIIQDSSFKRKDGLQDLVCAVH